MRVKMVRVLDVDTEVYFLVGKPEMSDALMLKRLGWGEPKEGFLRCPTLLVWLKSGGGVEGAMCSFAGSIEYDLYEYGPLAYSGTTHKLAKFMKDLAFEEIPSEVYLQKVKL